MTKDSSGSLAASLHALQRGDKFSWTPAANKAFALIKEKMTLTPVLGPSEFWDGL